jgi:hypothetical protein
LINDNLILTACYSVSVYMGGQAGGRGKTSSPNDLQVPDPIGGAVNDRIYTGNVSRSGQKRLVSSSGNSEYTLYDQRSAQTERSCERRP